MRLIFAVAFFFSGFSSAIHLPICNAETADDRGEWMSIFNGRDLDGWSTHFESRVNDHDPEKIFQIRDGEIHVYKDPHDGDSVPKGYFSSRVEYSHFHLRFQYKWGTKKFPPRYEMPRDAGVMYHVVGNDRIWPQSIECQVEEGDTGGCITVESTGLTTTVGSVPLRRNDYGFKPISEGGVERDFASLRNVHFKKHGLHEVDGWNTVDLIVRGDREAIHKVNGQVVFYAKNLRRFDKDKKVWLPLDRGRILFQAECAEVFYRNIEIRPLESGPLHPAPPVSRVRVPEGFEVIQVAAPPLVEYPTLACFDDRGRLYVSEGANVNDPYEVIKKTLPRSIRRLEDTDGDGVFDRATVFADKMTFPYGGVWHEGALYVASDPSIWRLEDTDDDGVADKREEIITGFGSEGHSSAVKGGYLGRDGWIYFAGGNERGGYNLKGRDGRHLHDPRIAPSVFRMKPDGTGLEFIANGAAGLYDLCFAPNADLFGVVTILKYPRGDGLMHWVYGGAYQTSRGKSRYSRFTGDRMPPLVEWPQTSPSGAMYYESGAFGDEYRGSLFTAHFNTHVVTRNVIQPAGGTWKSVREENFVESSDLNCRFTDVLEDADGSLIVVNTGGWFRIGCPTSQVGEDALTGAIYRVRKIGQKAIDDPRGLKLDWETADETKLAKRLEDERFAVRDRAMNELARRGEASLGALGDLVKNGSAKARCDAVWTLTRIDAPGARALVRKALSDQDETVAKAATASVGLWRDAAAFELVLAQLKSPSAALRREAASSLGRIGNPAAVPELLRSLGEADDRFVEHSTIFALIEIDNPERTLDGLRSPQPAVARGALVALDQMASGRLSEEDLAPLLVSEDSALQQATLEILSGKGWTKGVLPLLESWMDEPESANRLAVLSDALWSFRDNRAVQQLIAERLADAQTSLPKRKMLVDVIAKSKMRKFPAVWHEPLETCLLSENQELAEEAIVVVAAIGRERFQTALQTLAMDVARPLPLRLVAASALLAGDRAPDDSLFDLLLTHCMAEETDAVTRLTISKALGNAPLSSTQLERMIGLMNVAGPIELPLLIRAYEESIEPAAGEKLFEALAASPGLANLSPIRIKKLAERYPEHLQSSAKSLIERLSQQSEEDNRRLKALSFALEGGDPLRGKAVFYGASACSQCHRVGPQGSGVGPDLSRIGEIRTRRDLLEAIVLPSATLARGYEPVTIVTTSGKPISGIIRRETTRELILMTADRSELTIPRSDVDEISPSRVSIMPQGLDRNLKPEELRDLLAFLASLRGN